MDTKKLFAALVLSSSLACTQSEREPANADAGSSPEDAESAPDTASPPMAPASDAGPQTPTDELQNCGFCPTEECCDDGVLLDGFECCWNSSC